jgi:hypothetical protein
MTGTCFGTTVKDILNRKIDFLAFVFPLDFDSVGKGRDGGVSPTGSTVLGDVLVEVLGDEGFAVDVGPVPGLGEVGFLGVGVGEGGG